MDTSILNADTTRLAGRRVFVAGDTGLVGSALVQALLNAHPTVSVVGASRAAQGPVDDPRFVHIQADLGQRENCRNAVRGCDRAVLAAACTGGAAQAGAAPWRQVTDNVVMDCRLLEALHEEGIRRIVYIGTASSYQDFDGAIREDQMDWAADPHPAHLGVGWAKRYIEKQCLFWHVTTGMEIVVVRAANVYGPRAKFDPAVSNVVAALIRKAVDGMDPFEIWGDPAATRDLIYSNDFARAMVLCLAHEEIVWDTFNVGSGTPTTIAAIAEHALAAADFRPREIRRVGSAPTTIRTRLLDCSKIQQMIGWKPGLSAAEGIRATTDWWLRHKETWTR